MGLVHKERQSDDRRMLSLKLSARGNALLDSIAPLRRQVNDVQFNNLTAADFRQLTSLIYRLIESGDHALSMLQFLKENNQISAAE